VTKKSKERRCFMKKIFSFKSLGAFLLCVLMIVPTLYVFAQNSTPAADWNASLDGGYYRVVEFSEMVVPFSATDADIAAQRLLYLGFSQSKVDTLPECLLSRIAGAERALVSVVYFAEEFIDDEFVMVEISESEFESRYVYAQFTIPPIEIIDEEGNILYSPPRPRSPHHVGGGTLHILSALFDLNWGSEFDYVSEFVWTTMPNYRGNDFFGITRSNNTLPSFNAQGTTYWGGWYGFFDRMYYLLAPGMGGPVLVVYSGTNSVIRNNLPNQDPVAAGFVIRIDSPSDIWPSFMFPNQQFLARTRYGLQGGVWYGGHVTTPNATTNVSHWSTYLHQTGTRLVPGFSLSVPKGMPLSISVTPSSSYSRPLYRGSNWTWHPLFHGWQPRW
jgi:hypothetical protein